MRFSGVEARACQPRGSASFETYYGTAARARCNVKRARDPSRWEKPASSLSLLVLEALLPATDGYQLIIDDLL